MAPSIAALLQSCTVCSHSWPFVKELLLVLSSMIHHQPPSSTQRMHLRSDVYSHTLLPAERDPFGMNGALARVAAAQRSRLFPAADGVPGHGHQQQSATAGSLPSSSLTFIPAPQFMGTRPGYAFSKGPQGLGYYSETSEHGAMQPPQANGAAGEQNHRHANGVTGHAKGSRSKRRGLANGAQRHGEDLPNAVDEGESSGEEDGGLMGTMAPMKGAEMTQRELVAQAFAGDDVEADFQQVRL